MPTDTLPLRDVHLPPPPSWWPPAPGWWWLGAAVLLFSLALAGWAVHRSRRQRRWLALFEQTCGIEDPGARIAAMSALLRRAARRVDVAAGSLQGEAWLRFLDGRKGHDFSQGAGRLLLEGGFRRGVEDEAVAATARLARMRFLELMRRRA